MASGALDTAVMPEPVSGHFRGASTSSEAEEGGQAVARQAMVALLAAVDQLIRDTPVLNTFTGWSADLPFVLVPAISIPAIPLIETLQAGETPGTAPVVAAVRGAAAHAHWQHTYTEAEVGRDFLNRYGWFELVGPGGHFKSGTARLYLAFWGEKLHYASHLHEAEELYFILSGGAVFHAQGEASIVLRPGQSRHHQSNQPHAMDTLEEPVLALVLWRGNGLDGCARMG